MPSPKKKKAACPDCQRHQQDVLELIRERDFVNEKLAEANRELDLLRLHFARVPSNDHSPDAFPLRYRIADQVNSQVKNVLGPWHQRGKKWMDRFLSKAVQN